MKPVYKRMIGKMREKEILANRQETWHLYIVECADGTLYTGVAKDLQLRLEKHNQGKGAKYTRTRLPIKLVYTEICTSRSHALIRECAVKSLTREQKKRLCLLY